MNRYYKEPHPQQLADNITYIVTDNCNLRCRYCYEKNKTPNDMPLSVALNAVDYFFGQYQKRYEDVIFDFIGGEPFVCIEICEAIIEKCIQRFDETHKWKSMIFNFSTNGTCFADEKVRKFIAKYECLSVGLSLDGCKEIHDYNRSGSFDECMKWFQYWRDNFPGNGVKATLNHEALPYLYESVKFLMGTCLEEIYMNTVYENVWQADDVELYYGQLIKAADYILNNGIYKHKYVSLFDINLLRKENLNYNSNWCGCGSSMIAVDYLGDLFPCTRFKTLSKRKPLVIGNIYKDNGVINHKKLKPFYFCHNTCKTPDCERCEARAGCPNCTAFCYDETGSIFDRVSYMCDMHRARKRANEYYWGRMAEIENVTLEELMKNAVSTRQ